MQGREEDEGYGREGGRENTGRAEGWREEM